MLRLGVKPLAQLIRRRQVAQPCFDRCILLAKAPWPQAVNQHAYAIVGRRWFVYALHRHGHSFYYCTSGPQGRLAKTWGVSRLVNINKIIVFTSVAAVLVLSGCNAERRKSDEELGLTPQQVVGRRLYDNYCDRCHEPYSTSNKQGPSLKGMFKKPYLAESGLPANDERVREIIRLGRSKMRGFGDVLSEQQVQDLLAYLHTL